jgi:poly-gamma-glutamate synthase PgsB/CapB
LFKADLPVLALLLPPAVTLLFLLARGIRMRAALQGVPIRIHVGGTRGKSSVCRLIAAQLKAGSIRTIAKTTGTDPMLILPDGSARPWRRLGPASIGEQGRFALLARKLGARATVLECMAIRPEFISACERDLVRATIAVITNIRPDHLEDAPSMEAITEGFLGLVPKNGTLVVSEDALSPALRLQAHQRGTAIVAVSTSGLSADAANRTVARAVCAAAGTGTAAPQSHSVETDPGAFALADLDLLGKRFRFANAFACNDVVSLDLLWKEHAVDADHADVTDHADPAHHRAPVIAVLNHRNDRPLRSLQFLDYFVALRRRPQILLLGSTPWLRRAARHRGLDFGTVPAMPWVSGNRMLERIAARVPNGALVWGVGNYHGRGASITRALANGGHGCSL